MRSVGSRPGGVGSRPRRGAVRTDGSHARVPVSHDPTRTPNTGPERSRNARPKRSRGAEGTRPREGEFQRVTGGGDSRRTRDGTSQQHPRGGELERAPGGGRYTGRSRAGSSRRAAGGDFGRSAGGTSQPPRGGGDRGRSSDGESRQPRGSGDRGRTRAGTSQGAGGGDLGRSRGETSQRPRGSKFERTTGGGDRGRTRDGVSQRARGAGGRGRSRDGTSLGPRGGNSEPQSGVPAIPERSRGRAFERARNAAEPERLQKVLSRAGLASRREVEDWIRAGRITVNDEPAVLGVRVAAADHVRLDGRLIRQREVSSTIRVFLCHRSPGENLQQPVELDEQPNSEGTSEPSVGGGDVSSVGSEASSVESAVSSAHVSRGTRSGTPMLERIPRRAGRRFIPVSPMPRVDGGLELVTSDGDLASKLQRSMRGLTSEFSVRVHGELSPQGLESILQGVLDNGEKLEIERCDVAGGEGSNRWYSLAARGASGKDVRQLFERQGALVSRVLRTQLGSLALDRHLSRGRFRELSPEELAALLATTGAT
jgi:23S rRNA pseudouridine2605 synthase